MCTHVLCGVHRIDTRLGKLMDLSASPENEDKPGQVMTQQEVYILDYSRA